MKPEDALFGFGAWLTTRKKAVTFSRKHDAAIMCSLLKKFFEVNNLTNVSKKYPNTFKMPKEAWYEILLRAVTGFTKSTWCIKGAVIWRWWSKRLDF